MECGYTAEMAGKQQVWWNSDTDDATLRLRIFFHAEVNQICCREINIRTDVWMDRKILISHSIKHDSVFRVQQNFQYKSSWMIIIEKHYCAHGNGHIFGAKNI